MQDTAIWKDYLLQKVKGKYFPNANTLREEDAEKNFQIFEVLVSETIGSIYSNYCWHTTPANGDGGIDFWGEQPVRPMPEPFQMPPLIIYGQVKRKRAHFRQEDFIESTNKMIRYYYKTDLQKRSLHQLIHVISSDFPFQQKLKQEFEYKDSLYYVITTIDAKELFDIWARDPVFLQHILPTRQLSIERERFIETIVALYGGQNYAYDIDISVQTPAYCGCPFEVTVTLMSRVQFPIQLSAKWISDSQASVYLISPQGLLARYNGFPISLLRSYRLTIQCKSAVPGTQNLGCLHIRSRFGGDIEEIPLGEVEVKRALAPAYFELPNLNPDKVLRSELDERNSDLSFYSLVGEGGIGKTTLLQEVSNYAVNCGYRCIAVEHPCELTDEADFWWQLFRQLIGPIGATLSFTETMVEEFRAVMGAYYRESWTAALQGLFQSGSLQQLGELMECWLCLSILAADSGPLFIWFSNMHWCSPGAIDLFRRYLKDLKRNQSFFNHKIVIVFEGRTEEALNAGPSSAIPYEWLDFQKNPTFKEIRLGKWTKAQCRQYIDALLIREEAGRVELEQCTRIRQFLLACGSGNPMHINELIRFLKQQGNLEYRDDGRLRVNSSILAVSMDGKLLDIIRRRAAYYRETLPELSDFLILGAHLVDWPAFQQYTICFQKQSGDDLDSTLEEMGFAKMDRVSGSFSFVHEHYKTVFLQMSLSDDNSAHKCLKWAKETGISVPAQIECRLRLLCRNISYSEICKHLLTGLLEANGDLAYFEILQLLERIPRDILETNGMPAHRLYRLLVSACMEMGNWETAERYVQALKEMEDDSPAYQIDAIFARKYLSNNYSFRMKFDCAQEECEDAVAELENYLLQPPSMSPEEKRALTRELCLLRNRLSIIYYLSGNHEDAIAMDQTAQETAREENDLYVKYHIQYEQGLRDLRDNPEQGLALIQEAYVRLPQVEQLPGTQEIDLVHADYLMARLKSASVDGIFPEELLLEVKRDAAEGCRRLSVSREHVESLMYHAIYAIVSVIEGHLQEAIRYFQAGAEIAYRASLIHMIWKMHLNLAQCYCLLQRNQEGDLAEEYRRNIHFHAQETVTVLEGALQENIRLRSSFQTVLEYPLSLARELANGVSEPHLSGLSTDYCGIHIQYQAYAFFVLD